MDTSKSLEELEGEVWKNYEFPTELVRRSYELRKIPVANLDIDDLRLLISQEIGLKYLVTLALSILSDNILAEGNYYPGDLLKSILEIPKAFWQSDKSSLTELYLIIDKNISAINSSDIIDDSIKKMLLTGIDTLKK
ncbi:contact-dependent growth inhibition system immunity protein [Niabella drilacis]|uniref:Uncharacterized protein n=1 Tax=Niabella drilacis (strain DSM 25811 / CCM 8410 / CCUG 62505 / LMG 26954 / E90) TaxID=1285928 RepID=A0A1G6UQF3_NIADE|nr:contact-dependent growth inhibition system immunity protein [Niabella drilacis]SDD43572.1 hypothetical protein SAMN04487894_10958 [Niabella drilacis]